MAAFGASKAFKAGFQGSRSAIEEYRLEQQQQQQQQQEGCNRQYETERDEMEKIHRYRPSTTESIIVAFIRGLQVVFALTVSGLYGVDLQHACEKHVYTDAKWVYAEVVAALASVSSTTYLIIWLLVRREDRHQLSLNLETGAFFWLWGPFMCLLWLTLFGIFGKMYISENPEGVSGIVRMKHAVWIDLINLLLWVITTVWSAVRWWQCRATSTSEERPDTSQTFRDAPPRNREGFEQPQENDQERYVSPMGSRRNSHGSFQDAPVSPIRG